MRTLLAPFILTTLFAANAAAQATTIPVAEYQARRQRLAQAIGPNAVFIAFSPLPARRTGDVDWPFRQEDNLLYLTGVHAPETTLVILPGEPERPELIFVADRNPLREAWTGKIATHEEITAVSGVKEVASSTQVDAFMDALLRGLAFGDSSVYRAFRPPAFRHYLKAFRESKVEIWLLLNDRSQRDAPLTREQQFAEQLRRRYPEIRFRNASPLLVSMREVKTPAEMVLLQRAVDITGEAHKAAMRRVLTAQRENELQATIEYTFRNLGACCWAFPSIVASGDNATILHYERNDAPIPRDGLVLVDIGAEVAGYSADITRTYPADGTFSPDQRAIYNAVLAAQTESLPLMKRGTMFADVHAKAVEVVGRELLEVGLITKNVPEQARLYFFHGLGHHLGLQTHDVFDRLRTLEPGMVVTNEPGIYVRKNDVLASEVFKKLSAAEQDSIRKALDRYAGIGVRIEDVVVITEGEPRVISTGSPRTVEEIEKLMASSAR